MTEPIDEPTFDRRADTCLGVLETALGEIEGVDADLESGVLSVEFQDGVRFVINSHRAARQIWMAAGARAWHFDPEASSDRWIATKTGEELFACLAQQISHKLGRPITLGNAGSGRGQMRGL